MRGETVLPRVYFSIYARLKCLQANRLGQRQVPNDLWLRVRRLWMWQP